MKVHLYLQLLFEIVLLSFLLFVHFVDLLRYLAASEIEDFNYIEANDLKKCSDNFSIHLKFKNGSIGVINYLSNGNKAYPKEKLEILIGIKLYKL